MPPSTTIFFFSLTNLDLHVLVTGLETNSYRQGILCQLLQAQAWPAGEFCSPIRKRAEFYGPGVQQHAKGVLQCPSFVMPLEVYMQTYTVGTCRSRKRNRLDGCMAQVFLLPCS